MADPVLPPDQAAHGPPEQATADATPPASTPLEVDPESRPEWTVMDPKDHTLWEDFGKIVPIKNLRWDKDRTHGQTRMLSEEYATKIYHSLRIRPLNDLARVLTWHDGGLL